MVIYKYKPVKGMTFMNESHYIYKTNGQTKSEWAAEWSDIKAKYADAVLISQNS